MPTLVKAMGGSSYSLCPPYTTLHISQIVLQKKKVFSKLLKPDKFCLAHLAMGKGLLCYTVQNIHCDRVPALSHKYHVSSFPESSL